MISSLFSLISGFLFGMGLFLSGMLSPDNIIAFFQIGHDWNPAMLVVMASAIAISAIGHMLIRRYRSTPILDSQFHFSWDMRWVIDKRLIGGSVLFGVGWGISGLCPGPAIGLSVLGDPFTLGFLGAFLITLFLLQKYVL